MKSTRVAVVNDYLSNTELSNDDFLNFVEENNLARIIKKIENSG